MRLARLPVIAVLTLLICAVIASPSQAFRDLSPHAHSTPAIDTLAENGVVSGYLDDTFRPDARLYRAQFAKMVVGILGLPVSEGAVPCPFVDVDKLSSDLYPDDFVAVAADNDIINGYDGRHFGPYDPVLRIHVVTMVVRAAEALRPGRLEMPPTDYESRYNAAGDPTHGRNLAIAEYNGLLSYWPPERTATLDVWDLWKPAAREEAALMLFTAFGGELAPVADWQKGALTHQEALGIVEASVGPEQLASMSLPASLPSGWAYAAPPIPNRWGEPFEQNPFVNAQSRVQVALTDGRAGLDFVPKAILEGAPVHRATDWRETGMEFQESPIEMRYIYGGVVVASRSSRWVVEGEAWQRDDALALAETVREVDLEEPSLSWTETGSVPDEVEVRDLDFVDSNNGWLTGEAADGTDVLYSTGDGGETWTKVTESDTPSGVVEGWDRVDFFDEDNGWVCVTNVPEEPGEGETYYEGWTYSVLSTDDGGRTWHRRKITEDYFMPEGMEMLTADTGIVYGAGIHGVGSVMYRTTDDGASWTVPKTGDSWSSNGLSAAGFVDSSTGWVAGGWTGGDLGGHVVARTDDGGETWTAVYEEEEGAHDTWYRDIDFVDSSTGLLVGDEGPSDTGVLWKTNDGGHYWWPVSIPVDYALRHVAYLTPTVAVAGGEEGLIWSADGATSWTEVPGLTAAHMGSVADEVWVVTADGRITWGSLQ